MFRRLLDSELKKELHRQLKAKGQQERDFAYFHACVVVDRVPAVRRPTKCIFTAEAIHGFLFFFLIPG